MKTLRTQLTFILLFITCISCQTKSDTNWLGTYLFEHSLGEGAGGITRVVEYELTLPSSEKCELIISGFQVNETIICSLEKNGNSLKVNFKRYKDGKTKNALGVQVYPSNAPLFILRQAQGELITHWKNLRPDGVTTESGGYFSKTH